MVNRWDHSTGGSGSEMNESRSNVLALAVTTTLLVIRHLTHRLDLLSLLVLAPFLACLIPVLGSIQGTGQIQVRERVDMGLAWVDRRRAPWSYWISLLTS